jgi:hypothetical protein
MVSERSRAAPSSGAITSRSTASPSQPPADRRSRETASTPLAIEPPETEETQPTRESSPPSATKRSTPAAAKAARQPPPEKARARREGSRRLGSRGRFGLLSQRSTRLWLLVPISSMRDCRELIGFSLGKVEYSASSWPVKTLPGNPDP